MPPFDVHREMLAIELTSEQLLAKCRELQEVAQELSDEEAYQERSKKMLKGRLAEIETRYAALLHVVKTGREEAEMKVRTVYDLDRREVYHEREDTGEEINGRRRPMTDQEIVMEKARRAQTELPLGMPGNGNGTGSTASEEAEISGPLLQSCETCGCGKGDHQEDETGEHTGACLTCQMQGRTCEAFKAFEPVPAEESLEPVGEEGAVPEVESAASAGNNITEEGQAQPESRETVEVAQAGDVQPQVADWHGQLPGVLAASESQA